MLKTHVCKYGLFLLHFSSLYNNNCIYCFYMAQLDSHKIDGVIKNNL